MPVRALTAVLACLVMGLLAGCHEAGELSLPSFAELQGVDMPAGDSVDITLGRFSLWLGRTFIPGNDPEAAQVKRILRGLKRVRVRSFPIAADAAFPRETLERVRRQLQVPGWSPLVQTHDRKQGEDVDVYLAQDDQAIHGIAVIAAGAHELTIVNVVGTIEREDIARLVKMVRDHKQEAPKRNEQAQVSDPTPAL